MLVLHAIPDAFSPAECDRLVALSAAAPSQDAGLVRQTTDHNLRRADLVWLDDLPETDWVMDRLIDIVRVANRDVYDIDITEFAESPQIASYDAGREGHFGWHSDIGDGRLASRRKLTLVAQLSEPEEYEGGGLEVWFSAEGREAPRTRGTAVLFPSFALHRVTPVTGGQRRSLTVWAHGPRYR